MSVEPYNSVFNRWQRAEAALDTKARYVEGLMEELNDYVSALKNYESPDYEAANAAYNDVATTLSNIIDYNESLPETYLLAVCAKCGLEKVVPPSDQEFSGEKSEKLANWIDNHDCKGVESEVSTNRFEDH